MAQIVGTYKLEKSDNFDAILKEFGIGLILRKAILLAPSTVEFTIDGNIYVMKTTSFKSSELKFELDKEFEEERQDGVKVKTTFSLEGNVLKQVQRGGKKDVHFTRTFTDDGLVLEIETNGVKGSRTYSRVK